MLNFYSMFARLSLFILIFRSTDHYCTMADAVRELWREVDAVCFDVDSTVIQEEAIDEVANFCGKGQEVKQL